MIPFILNLLLLSTYLLEEIPAKPSTTVGTGDSTPMWKSHPWTRVLQWNLIPEIKKKTTLGIFQREIAISF